jgi:Skp family chaperone for outer membrane proteins
MVKDEVPPSENRAAVARKLEALLNRRAEKVKDTAEEEIDAVVDEAVDHVRHSGP